MKLNESNTFFTSDSHFFHKKIIEYQKNRGCSSVEEMNELLIDNWNKTVSPDSTVIHHGDFSFSSKTNISSVRARLNGRIILIMGNHDYYSKVVDAFGEENIYHSKYYWVGGQLIHSCHFPMASWIEAENGSWMLHGHYHGSKVDDNIYKRMDVGIDTHPELRPYSFNEIKEYMKDRNETPGRH